MEDPYRLTQYAHGGGCACKIPPGELEDDRPRAGLIGRAIRPASCSSGSTAATTRRWCASTAARRWSRPSDFFTPVVDDAYDWGRIAAANALSDVYAMGGRPVVAVNLLGWPRDVLPFELAAEVLRGGLRRRALAGCHRRRWAQRRRPGAEVRHGGHRDRATRTGCCATTPATRACRCR